MPCVLKVKEEQETNARGDLYETTYASLNPKCGLNVCFLLATSDPAKLT